MAGKAAGVYIKNIINSLKLSGVLFPDYQEKKSTWPRGDRTSPVDAWELHGQSLRHHHRVRPHARHETATLNGLSKMGIEVKRK